MGLIDATWPDRVPLADQLSEEVGPVILINTFQVAPEDVDALLRRGGVVVGQRVVTELLREVASLVEPECVVDRVSGLVGRDPDPALRRLASDHIVVTGRVAVGIEDSTHEERVSRHR